MRKTIRRLLIVLCLALLTYSGWQLYRYGRESLQSSTVYTALAEEAIPSLMVSSDPSEQEEAESLFPQIDFDALTQINEDTVAWLSCEGTPINYPVVQGTDNAYYLTHLFDGTENANGCLFLDSRVACDFSGGNSIIYGHYRKNGSMFAALAGYKEQSYYDQYPQMLLITPESAYTVELFSGYVTGTDGQAWQTVFSDEEAFVQWLGFVADASMFQSDIEPMASDRILTLSTCSYEFENARFVVHGVLRPLSN